MYTVQLASKQPLYLDLHYFQKKIHGWARVTRLPGSLNKQIHISTGLIILTDNLNNYERTNINQTSS